MLKKLKGYMMPIAMTLGVVLHNYVGVLSFSIPYLIFVMLLLTYSKLRWQDIRFTALHAKLLGIQLLGSIAIYVAIAPFSTLLAQAVMVCVLAPTATSAPVIAGMLKGNIASLTAYSMLSNLLVVFVAPLFFTIISDKDVEFMASVLGIGQRIFLLLVVPFILSVLLHRFAPKVNDTIKRNAGLSFYMWTFALIVVSGNTVRFVINQNEASTVTVLLMAFGSLIVCGLQFLAGRRIGRKHNDTVAGGQGLGQKNTVLCIWMTQTYLNPIASIGPGSYVLWQNMVNSYQVWRQRKSI